MGALATTVGRWNIFVCEACGEPTGRHKDCEGARRTATEVVPVDDAAIERAARAIYRAESDGRNESWEDYAYAVPVFAQAIRAKAEDALRAAGQTA